MGAEKLSGGRAARVTLRTVHIIAFSVFLGGHWFDVPAAEAQPWLRWSVLSGAGLMLLELRAGLDWLLQLAGVFTALKLAVLCLVPVFPEHGRPLLLLAVAIGSVGSHMPSSLRHYRVIQPPPSSPSGGLPP